jgi:MFS family permease
MATENSTATADTDQSKLQQWAPLIAVSLAMFIVVDSTMMNVAISAIVRDLKTNVTAVQGAISIYSLVMASLMLAGGKLGAIRGVKRMFTGGLIIYGVGTLLAAISWNVGILMLGWSILEGIAAALLLPLAFTLIVANYEDRKQRAFAFAVLGGVQASAAAVGPILGGVLTTFASWRWGFGGQVLVVLVTFFFLPYLDELVTAEEGATLDWGGTLLSILSLGSIVTGFLLAGQYGWWTARRPFVIGGVQFNPAGLSPTPLLVALGVTLVVVFIHWQFRREHRGEMPLLHPRIFSNGRFLSGVSTYTVRSVFLAGFLFVVPIFLQSALEFNAFESGLAILPFSLATFVVSLGSSSLSNRIAPKRLIQFGLVTIGLGLVLLYSVTSLTMTITTMIVPMSIIGIGVGLMIAQLVNLTLSTVEPDDTPEASGVTNAFDSLGNALGTAVIGSALFAFFYGGVVDGVLRAGQVRVTPSERESLVVLLEDASKVVTPREQEAFIASLPPDVQAGLSELFNVTMINAQQETLLLIMLFVLVTLLLSSFLPKHHLRETNPDVQVEIEEERIRDRDVEAVGDD